MNCRHCARPLRHNFLDLGFAPPSNAYLTDDDLSRPEKYYPLRVKFCDGCWLVQTEDYANANELFSPDYAYFSSTSSSWVKHARDYSDHVIERFNLRSNSQVVEIASNDGYLLHNFVSAGIPCLGIEPTTSTAKAAEARGIPVLREFFGEALAQKLRAQGVGADLIIGNNVYAHVPDINDFTRGLARLLKPEGVITLEFPHLLELIRNNQFDTVYHEHFSYLSLSVVERIFSTAGLRVWDVDQLSTHGGSLRVFGCLATCKRKSTNRIKELITQEKQEGLGQLDTYVAFQAHADKVKNELLAFLIEQKRAGKSVVGYGAAAKGNTLLNYAGVKHDLLPYVCDAAPSKQGKHLPGSHIPILPPNKLRQETPDWVLILPWNIADEVCDQLADLATVGTRFLSAVPEIRTL